MRRVQRIVCLLSFLLPLALVGCKRPAPQTSSTIIFARGADSQKLDPADIDDGESVKVLDNICEGLVRFKPGSTEIEPCLATSWTISPDGLTYTFKIRRGVRFHDGVPVDAPAATFSFLRQMDKSHPGHLPQANYPYWSALYSMVESVQALDADTLEFRLREPHAPFLANLAIFPVYLISPHFIDQRHPVGTGPYRFIEWVPNEKIVLEANPDYWDGPPPVPRAIFKVVPDSATRIIQLQTGEIHMMDGVDPNDLPAIQRDKSLKLLAAPGLNVCYLSFNTQKPPLDDKNLRRAIASAINKPDLISAVYRGAAVVAKNPMPPFVPGYNDAIADRSNASTPLGAGSTLQPRSERGQRFNDLRPLKFHVMTNPRPYLPNPLRAAELIKADVEKIGIKLEIVPNEWGAHLSRTERGEHDLALLGWIGDNIDADVFLYLLLDKTTAVPGSALNISFWKNDAYHELVAAARRELDPAKRIDLYRRAQEIVYEEAPMVPLAHSQDMVAVRANVEGFLLQPNGDIILRRVSLR